MVEWWLAWDWPAAEAAFRRAIEIDPRGPPAHRSIAHVLSQMGRHEEARAAARYAHELDPLDPMLLAMASQIAFQSRDYRDAAARARQAIAIDQEFWIGHMQLGQAYEQTGEAELALAALERAERLSGGNSKPISLRGYLLARNGRSAEARQVISALETTRARGRYVPPYATALVYAGLGDANAVFEWLDRARAVRDVHLMFLTVDAKWDSYRLIRGS